MKFDLIFLSFQLERTMKLWFLLLSLILFFVSSFAQNQPNPKTFPEFSFVKTTGEVITKKNIPTGKPVIVFFFDPDCDHCQKQASWIKTILPKFSHTTLFWVSTAEMQAIQAFQKEYFPSATNAIFAKDTKYQFDNYFGYSVAPSIYVFDSKGNFVKGFKNEVAAEELLKLAK
ncbi:MAG: redoxin domain-containing protein [Bacteroidia bacterium]|nr:redoxin domain-containing protein [Bacteroidia bacterium]